MNTIHASLTRPALLGGSSRMVVAALYITVAILLATFPLTYVSVAVSLLLVTVGHSTLVYLSYHDPQWWPILLGHLQQHSTYTASGDSMLFTEFRAPQHVADLVPYDTLIAPGVVALKNFGLLAAYTYTGPDLEVAAPEELTALSQHLNMALCLLGGGWTLHVDLFRYESQQYPGDGAFPDPTSLLIEEERRQQTQAAGAQYESITCLAFTYEPPREMARTMRTLLVNEHEDEAVRSFEQQLGAVVGILSARLRLARLEGADLLTYLHRCTTGQAYRVGIPTPPAYLDVYLASQDLVGGYYPQVGELHQRTVSVTGFPPASRPAMLAFLSQMPCAYRWNSRFVFLEPHDARKLMSRARSNWDASTVRVFDKLMHAYFGEELRYENLSAKELAADANTALHELDAGAVRYGHLTSVIVLYHTDERVLDALARNVVSELQNHQFPARLEKMNALSAFLGSLPGMTKENVRAVPVNSLNVADLIPATTIWPGLGQNPCPYYPEGSPPLLHARTGGQTPFRLNLHVGDVGHTLLIGRTGSGKTTHNNLLMLQFLRYSQAQVFCFDRGYGAELTTRACGGLYLDLANDQSLTFCPLAHVDDEGERLIAAEWLEDCLLLHGVEVGVEQRKAIHRALDLLAQEESRTMSDFVITVQDRTVSEGLKAYTGERAYGWLFDGGRDDLQERHLTTFDLTRLMEVGEKYLLPALLHLFNRIARRLDGRPTLITIDEGWMVLLHSAFAAQLVEWLRTLRAKNAAVIFITQSVADVVRSEHAELFLQQCLTKIFLPDSEAEAAHIRPLYEGVGLNSTEIATLARMLPQREYFYTSPLGRRVYQLGLGPAALAFCGSGGAEQRRQWQALAAVNRETWPAAWLSKLEAKEEARVWREMAQRYC